MLGFDRTTVKPPQHSRNCTRWVPVSGGRRMQTTVQYIHSDGRHHRGHSLRGAGLTAVHTGQPVLPPTLPQLGQIVWLDRKVCMFVTHPFRPQLPIAAVAPVLPHAGPAAQRHLAGAASVAVSIPRANDTLRVRDPRRPAGMSDLARQIQ